MERLTYIVEGKYELKNNTNISKAINKLAEFENLYETLIMEREKIVCNMERLKSQGKSNTAGYKQYISSKMLITNFINQIEAHIKE